MLEQDVEKVSISEEELKRRITEMGRQITQEYHAEPLTIVGILKGASIFFADLARSIDLPLQMDFMSVSSYGTEATSSGVVKIIKDLDADVTGRHILLVEDIIDTGITLAYLRDYLSNRGAKSVKICTLLDKPSRREKAVQVDYIGFTMPDEFIIGYGIDYAENYRNLPYVASLKRSVYEK